MALSPVPYVTGAIPIPCGGHAPPDSVDIDASFPDLRDMNYMIPYIVKYNRNVFVVRYNEKQQRNPKHGDIKLINRRIQQRKKLAKIEKELTQLMLRVADHTDVEKYEFQLGVERMAIHAMVARAREQGLTTGKMILENWQSFMVGRPSLIGPTPTPSPLLPSPALVAEMQSGFSFTKETAERFAQRFPSVVEARTWVLAHTYELTPNMFNEVARAQIDNVAANLKGKFSHIKLEVLQRISTQSGAVFELAEKYINDLGQKLPDDWLDVALSRHAMAHMNTDDEPQDQEYGPLITQSHSPEMIGTNAPDPSLYSAGANAPDPSLYSGHSK